MSLIAARFQPLDAARPGQPLRVRDLQTAQTLLLREADLPDDRRDAVLAHAARVKGVFHPSLVTLFDVVPADDARVWLAYEYVAAQPLIQVSGGQPLHARRAAELMAEIADAVAELHARDAAHGAISQHTVLVTMKGKAKLDRAGDPSTVDAQQAVDLEALGSLLDTLAARPRDGHAGTHAIDTLVARARAGRFDSAAAFAALLRRL